MDSEDDEHADAKVMPIDSGDSITEAPALEGVSSLEPPPTLGTGPAADGSHSSPGGGRY